MATWTGGGGKWADLRYILEIEEIGSAEGCADVGWQGSRSSKSGGWWNQEWFLGWGIGLMAVPFPREGNVRKVVWGKSSMPLKRVSFKYHWHSCGRARLAVVYMHLVWPHESVSHRLRNCILRSLGEWTTICRKERRAQDEFPKHLEIRQKNEETSVEHAVG